MLHARRNRAVLAPLIGSVSAQAKVVGCLRTGVRERGNAGKQEDPTYLSDPPVCMSVCVCAPGLHAQG